MQDVYVVIICTGKGMSLTVSISKKLSCCESNATSPSCCERYRRVLVMFEAVVLIHSSYQTDPVRYTPELRGVVPAIAARNVDFPAPLCYCLLQYYS